MKTRLTIITTLLVAAGCSSYAGTGALAGSAIGAGAGAAIGHNSGDTVGGALTGAAVGAAAGAAGGVIYEDAELQADIEARDKLIAENNQAIIARQREIEAERAALRELGRGIQVDESRGRYIYMGPTLGRHN